jgi:hypothetical protein
MVDNHEEPDNHSYNPDHNDAGTIEEPERLDSDIRPTCKKKKRKWG